MKIILLTSFFNDEPIYVNIEKIGLFYKSEKGGTKVEVTTDSSGILVNESPELIMKLIKRAGII